MLFCWDGCFCGIGQICPASAADFGHFAESDRAAEIKVDKKGCLWLNDNSFYKKDAEGKLIPFRKLQRDGGWCEP